MFALCYNQLINSWYLIDWNRAQFLKNTLIAPFLVVGQWPTGTVPDKKCTGGFRYNEIEAILLFNEYPTKEVEKIRKEYLKMRTPRVILRGTR